MCNIFLPTPASPIILSGCDNIKLAPFNSSYPSIIDDAFASGLSESLNLWDKPTAITHNQSLVGSHWTLMSPSDFALVTVPIDVSYNKSQSSSTELINRANVNNN
jgi:hypothetical protein